MKDFDGWNKVKKLANQTELPDNLFCHEREIWWCAMGINIGVESDGKDKSFERPILILRVFNKDMIWAIPITSTIKKSPFYYNFSFKEKIQCLMLTQLRTISTKRLKRRLGTVSEEDLKQIIYQIEGLLYKNETPPKGGESRRPKP